ncbi:MAG: PD40 domain-containing protein, partial [Candidatus Aminicenantes bacterium]|nr:PD40 domain-containing protein [Candidatus Aminicenantes bacterium]
AYERLVREYADQSDEADVARSRLAALAKPAAEDKESAFVARLVGTGVHGVFSHAPSPDGKSMTCTDWESGNLAAVDIKARKRRLLTDDGTWDQPAQYALNSRWSPDGKQLAYGWQYGTGTQLRILTVDDPKPRILFKDESEDVWVAPQDWSPDGEHILATISRTEGVELALVPAEGGSPRILKTLEPETAQGEIHFSPDGRYVTYSRMPGKVAASDIFVLDMKGGGETPLVQHPADERVFGWSPDGRWILFLSDRSGTLGLWAIQVADGKAQGTPMSVKPSVGRIAPLGFAKDGSFYYADVKVARDVYEARIDFETGTVLAPPVKAIERYEGSNMNPRYSPDGKSLAYVSRRGSMVFPTNRANALCICSLESGSERVFMDEFVRVGIRAVAGPRWSPDSRTIAVAGHRTGSILNGLYLVNLDTGKITTLLENPPDVRIGNHEFSPDSRRLYYVRRDTKEEISRILARDLLTGDERELYRTSGIHFPFGVAASPDGKWLATITHPLALSVIPAGGGTPRVVQRLDQLTRSEWMVLAPEWMPDGKAILVGWRSEDKGSILFRVPAEGGESLEIVLEQRLGDRPTVHPDGRRIAFGSNVNHDTDADVWVMRNFLPELKKSGRSNE